MPIISYKKLYLAYLDCRKAKRHKNSAIEFELDLEKNLKELLSELRSGEYTPGKSICFVVTKPKPREIFAANFRDRIVHHLLVNELMPAGESAFVFDSYACRPGKGTHRAVARLRQFLHLEKAGKKPLYFLQLDIDAFFMNIDKEILLNLAAELIAKQPSPAEWKCEAFWLANRIISHDPTKDFQINSPPEYFGLIAPRKSLFGQPAGKGLPIGNYSSQFFANLYLNKLDHFIKRALKCRRYIRYVDDFILLDQSPEKLKKWMREINAFCAEKLKLKISSRKIRLQEAGKGIDWLGYFVKPGYTLARRAVVARFKDKIKSQSRTGVIDKSFKAMLRSYFGHFSHADCRLLRNRYADYLK